MTTAKTPAISDREIRNSFPTENEEQKDNLLTFLESLTGGAFRGSDLKHPTTIERISFGENKFSVETADVVEPNAGERFRSDPYYVNNLPYVSYIYNGQHMLRLEKITKGGPTNYVAIIEEDKMDITDFGKFGRNASVIDKQMIDDIEKGHNVLDVQEVGGKTLVRIEDKNTFFNMSLELQIDSSHAFMLDRVTFNIKNSKVIEREYLDYNQTANGYWFPHLVIERTFIPSGDGSKIVSEITYETLRGSVDLNNKIDENIFSAKLPGGTTGVDFTSDPPRDFEVQEDGTLNYEN